MAQLAKRKALNMNDLDNNLNNLVKNIKIKQQLDLINKIKEWLEDTGEFDERLDDIDIGFIQCQQNLLELIKKWEKQ
jgi:hypothetical protein